MNFIKVDGSLMQGLSTNQIQQQRVKGLVAFYDEFVDKVLVDGVEQPRPISASSHGYY